ncbi:hypothetical protein DM860_006102 [Cuscuta australis]|uniref:Pentacotripeptide-repeat region of PRORP domain-containing protein n=1 Tax=Cuscuta australis TaxID=267555 RepID=A0A328DMS3_9ASTE|nr:hypothetical protein DM860_006102 [Cuscuta australis]
MIISLNLTSISSRIISVQSFPVAICRLLHSNPYPPLHNEDVDKIFRIITTARTPDDMKQSLKFSQISISSETIDGVLKRARFSHSNPLLILEFFKFTSKRREFFHSAFSYDTMLYILGRGRKFDEVWEILKEMKRKDQSLITSRTVQVVLARLAKVCSVLRTVESFWKLKKFVPQFDTRCFNALLRSLCQEKCMLSARNVYRNLKRDFKPDLQTFNILLSGWKSSEEAEEFFSEMREHNVDPDVVSYNCLVDVYCKGREVGKAFEVVTEMRERDIDPDVITYTSLIGGLGLVGQPDKAKKVLTEMREYGCYPDVAAYNAAIRNFCIANRIGDAFKLVDEMAKQGLDPNATTYNVFLRSFHLANDLKWAWSLYQKMKENGCLPNTQSCMFLIRLTMRHENAEMALELWNDMVEKGFGSYTLVSDVLFDLLCDLGMLKEAETCFLQMVEMGQKPSNVSFKRIKVLMKLADKGEAIQNLSDKMAAFSSAARHSLESQTSNFESNFMPF